MTIDRYYPAIDATDEFLGMDVREDGNYVHYEDHEKCVRTKDEQIDFLKQLIRDMQCNQHFDFAAASDGLVD